MPIALYALALAAFAVGTAEFIIAGLLPTMAADLAVSIPTTGLLISGYALSVAIGGPLLALLTAHLPRRPMILAMVGLFVVMTAATFIATTFNLGYAAGALIGAALLSAGFDYWSLPVVGILCGLGATGIVLISWRMDRI
jgi:DHA1 family inner membrane transport protein